MYCPLIGRRVRAYRKASSWERRTRYLEETVRSMMHKIESPQSLGARARDAARLGVDDDVVVERLLQCLELHLSCRLAQTRQLAQPPRTAVEQSWLLLCPALARDTRSVGPVARRLAVRVLAAPILRSQSATQLAKLSHTDCAVRIDIHQLVEVLSNEASCDGRTHKVASTSKTRKLFVVHERCT
eukprot:2832192-Pleurochrysis_carterae.AAC.3